jgi:hypothetical protein
LYLKIRGVEAINADVQLKSWLLDVYGHSIRTSLSEPEKSPKFLFQALQHGKLDTQTRYPSDNMGIAVCHPNRFIFRSITMQRSVGRSPIPDPMSLANTHWFDLV